MTFVEGLEQLRLELGLGHVAFAHYLGMSHGYWSLVRNGHKPAGTGFIGRVITTHPELVRLLIAQQTEEAAAA